MTTTTRPLIPSPLETSRRSRLGAEVVVDGAYLLPRTLVAGRRLVRGDGVERYRATFPSLGPCAAGDLRTSPARIATHAALGLLLGLLTVAVVGGFAVAVARDPLLLGPVGVAALVALAVVGAAHRALTRHLIDRRLQRGRRP